MALFVQRRGWSRVPLLVVIAAVLCASGMAGCSSNDSPTGPVGDETGIPGSGDVTAESRDVAGFDQVLFRSEGRVIVTVAGTESLVIEADDNLQHYLRATATGSVLEISTTEGIDIAPSEPPVFRIEIANIAAIDLAGAGTIEIPSVETDRLDITLSGVGDLTIGSLTVDQLVVNLDGVGTVSLTGAADRQEARVAGVSVYDAANLASRSATIEGAGTGQATVWVTGDLEIVAADAGSVSYYGTPTVTQSISALATVNPLGSK